MLLRSRLILLVILAVLAICVAFAVALWQRTGQLTERYNASLIDGQRLAWSKLEKGLLDTLKTTSTALVRRPEWLAAWGAADRSGTLGTHLDQLLSEQSGWRVDVFDAQRRLLYSSAREVDPAPMLEAGWLARALPVDAQGVAGAGLVQVSRDHYYWVHAQSFGSASAAGVVAIGMPVEPHLAELAASLDGEVYLLNLRGRPVAGRITEGLLAAISPGSTRSERVWTAAAADGRVWRGASLPLTGFGQTTVGALVLMRDDTLQAREDFRFNLMLFGGGGAFVLLFLVLLYAYLRAALEPMGRAVDVLGALARGDLETSLDDGDEMQDDEAGHIGRGIVALRQEMLNLQMLRDERTRTRQQQERLIREQLKALAESLDPESRAEILASLEGDPDSAGNSRRENHLAELAGILSRMSELVTTQQARLLKLLKDLQAAMANEALLASLQQELDIARNMQLSILPRNTPLAPEVDMSATMIPAREVGGDFYDYFLIDQDHLAVVIADVSGKGVPAAFFMAISRTLLKSVAQFLRSPAEAIGQLNDQLDAENEQMMFVTMFFGVLDLRSGELMYVNAGHNPPILLQAGAPPALLPQGQNMALAVMGGYVFREGLLRLAPGDSLFLYTDGVTEAVNPGDDLFGTERLLEALVAVPPVSAELPPLVLRAVRKFEDGCAQADDITCLALRYLGR